MKSDNDGVIISCGLLLPPEQAKLALSFNSIIAKKGQVKYLLNQTTRPPLVKIYETVFPQHNVSKVVELMEKISQKMVIFPMTWEEMEITDNLVILWGELNEPFDLFHQAVLLELNSLREGYFKQKYLQNKFFLAEEKNSFKKWGVPWAENYLPHLVLAKAKTKFKVFKLDLEWEYKHCLFSEIFVGIKDQSGKFSQHYIFNLQPIPHLKQSRIQLD